MKVAKIRKGLLLLVVASAFGLGCELIVDFDRSKIPVEGTDATPQPNEAGGSDTGTDTGTDAGVDTGTDADTGTDSGELDSGSADADADV